MSDKKQTFDILRDLPPETAERIAHILKDTSASEQQDNSRGKVSPETYILSQSQAYGELAASIGRLRDARHPAALALTLFLKALSRFLLTSTTSATNAEEFFSPELLSVLESAQTLVDTLESLSLADKDSSPHPIEPDNA